MASYTRTLAQCLHSLGAKINLLLATASHARRDDPDFVLATQVFCNRRPKGRLTQLAYPLLRSRFGLKRKVEAVEVKLNGVDLTFLEPSLPHCSKIFNAESPLEVARLASIWGSHLATILTSETFVAHHWTGPVPLKSINGPNVYTIHDLVPIQFPYFVIDRPGHSARVHTAIARQADLIITVSETSKASIQEILKVPDERIAVTYQPAPMPRPFPKEDAEWLVRQFYGATPYRYALYVGAIEPKKNLRRLIEAFTLSRIDIPLLMAGPLGWLYDDEQELLATIERRHGTEVSADILATRIGANLDKSRVSTGVTHSEAQLPVRHLGYLPGRHVTALLQCAKFFLFPSLYEGFGLPALEAMQLGIPVLTSRTGSLCEVVGDAALLVNPLSVDDITRGIRHLDSDRDLRAELGRRGAGQAAKFSEARYAQRLREAYARVGIMFPDRPDRSHFDAQLTTQVSA